MINILFTISAFRKTGPNKVMENIIESIDRKKYRVFALSYLDDDNPEVIETLKKMNVIVFSLKLKRKFEIIQKGVSQLNKIIFENDISIIHSHGILPDISNAKSKVPIKITTIHDNMFEDYIYTFGKIKGNIFIKWHIHYLKRFQKCVCCSSTSYKCLKKHLNNCTYIRNSIYKHPINKDDYFNIRNRIRKKYNIGKNDIVYIYAGKLSKLKRIEELICFFNNNLKKNQYLFVLGNGELEEVVKTSIKNKSIIFCGFCNNVEEYMISSDIYCSFSSSEGFSISVLEALQTYNLLFLNEIPSHKEVFEINSKNYLGETFNNKTVVSKNEILIKNVSKAKYGCFDNFLNENLSILKMSSEYGKVYSTSITDFRKGSKA